jgi:hypothetical protein
MGATCGGEGLTAAHLAARWGHTAVLEVLQAGGADLSASAAGSGKSVEQEATDWGRPACVELLRRLGRTAADVSDSFPPFSVEDD